jgi:hypothetical protein
MWVGRWRSLRVVRMVRMVRVVKVGKLDFPGCATLVPFHRVSDDYRSRAPRSYNHFFSWRWRYFGSLGRQELRWERCVLGFSPCVMKECSFHGRRRRSIGSTGRVSSMDGRHPAVMVRWTWRDGRRRTLELVGLLRGLAVNLHLAFFSFRWGIQSLAMSRIPDICRHITGAVPVGVFSILTTKGSGHYRLQIPSSSRGSYCLPIVVRRCKGRRGMVVHWEGRITTVDDASIDLWRMRCLHHPSISVRSRLDSLVLGAHHGRFVRRCVHGRSCQYSVQSDL